MSGDVPSECAVNGRALRTLLQSMAVHIDTGKIPTSQQCKSLVNSSKILNEKITYI